MRIAYGYCFYLHRFCIYNYYPNRILRNVLNCLFVTDKRFRIDLRRGSTPNKITWVQQRQDHRGHESARERVLSLALRGGSTPNKITWSQQRQDHRGHESARERMLSLALRGG